MWESKCLHEIFPEGSAKIFPVNFRLLRVEYISLVMKVTWGCQLRVGVIRIPRFLTNST